MLLDLSRRAHECGKGRPSKRAADTDALHARLLQLVHCVDLPGSPMTTLTGRLTAEQTVRIASMSGSPGA